MLKVHKDKDVAIEEGEAKKLQQRLNGHVSMLKRGLGWVKAGPMKRGFMRLQPVNPT